MNENNRKNFKEEMVALAKKYNMSDFIVLAKTENNNMLTTVSAENGVAANLLFNFLEEAEETLHLEDLHKDILIYLMKKQIEKRK